MADWPLTSMIALINYAPPALIALVAALVELLAGRWAVLPVRMTLMTPFFRLGRWFERRLNRRQRSPRARLVRGLLVMLILILLALGAGSLSHYISRSIPVPHLVDLVLLVLCLNTGRRWRVAARVAQALILKEKQKNSPEKSHSRLTQHLRRARRGLAYFSRRDMGKLDDFTLCRMAVEIIGRGVDRGLAGPIFWYLLMGLPGLWLMAMTMGAARSVGILGPHIEDFGLMAARCEKVMLLIPAWLAMMAWLVIGLVLFPKQWPQAWQLVRRGGNSPLIDTLDRWLLGPLTGYFDIAVLGPRSEACEVIQMPWLGHGTARITPILIRKITWAVLLVTIFLLFLTANLVLLSLS